MNKNQFAGCVKVMESQRVVVEDGSLLRLTIAPQGTPIDYCELIGIEKTVSEAQIDRIKAYASCAKKDYDKRIGAFLLEQIDAGSCYFTKKEYETYANQFSTTTIVKDMLRARRLGLIRRYLALGTVVYAISFGLDGQAFPDPSYEASANVEERNYCSALTPFRKHRLTGVYNTFGTNEFTRREYEEAFHITDARQTLIPLVGLNLITERQSQGRYFYRLAIKPEERPECFNPSAEEEIVNPIQTFSVWKHEGAELKQKGSAQKQEGAVQNQEGHAAQNQEGAALAVQQRRRRIKSATETTEEHEIKLAKKRDAYATQPPEKLEAMRAKMRARARARLASETPEEREKRLSKEQERRRIIKATETPEEHEKKLAAKRAYYAAQPQEKLEARRAHMREQARARRVAETPAERENRLAAEQEQRHRKWAAETPEEREKRLATNREYQRKRRVKETKANGGAHDTGLHTRPGIHK